jgi:hypothetical protein
VINAYGVQVLFVWLSGQTIAHKELLWAHCNVQVWLVQNAFALAVEPLMMNPISSPVHLTWVCCSFHPSMGCEVLLVINVATAKS